MTKIKCEMCKKKEASTFYKGFRLCEKCRLDYKNQLIKHLREEKNDT